MPDQRNLFIAIALSIVVLIGWQYFIAGPQIERARQQQIEAQQAAETAPAQGGESSTAGAPAVGTPPAELSLSRAEALKKSPRRVTIATGRLSGSIDLTGARIDDLHLVDFHETVDPGSPTIVLLSPSGGPNAYFAEFGWIGPDEAGPYPGPETVWSASAGARLAVASPVTLTYDNGAGLLFTRTIAVDDKYMFSIADSVANSSQKSVELRPFGRVIRVGEPEVAGWYILHEGFVGYFTEANLEEIKYSKLEDQPTYSYDSNLGWLGMTDKYWATALIPPDGKSFEGHFQRIEQPALSYQADFAGEPITIAGGASADYTSRLFAGAKQVAVVEGYEDALNIKLFGRLIDWGWFYFITQPLFHLLDWFFRLFGNFGVAILAVTILVKAAFFPLANKSYKSMSAMKKLQPKIAELKERYKDDKVKQQQAQMALFKTEKINPLAGCWPIAVQIPVFFALYKVLFVTIEMRHAPFFGWIKDLAAADPTSVFNLFGLLPFDPPSLLMVGVWPLIMGVTMFVQMKLNPTPPDPTQAMIFTWMPIVFTFMLASFPAGLVIYWAWNNTLSVTQQYVIMRRQGVDVNLFGNIAGTFQRKKAAQPSPAASSAKSSPVTPETSAANDDPGEELAKPRKGAKPKQGNAKTRRGKVRSKAKS